MRRRHWLVAAALLVAGCSSPKTNSRTRTTSKTKSRKKPGSTAGRSRMNSGPQGFGNVLVPAYIEDLKTGSPDKQIAAARELENMGSGAKAALPTLEKLVSDKNSQVSAAARSAVNAIKKR